MQTETEDRVEIITLQSLLSVAVERGATDLILSVGQPPQIRVNSILVSMDQPKLTPQMIKLLCYGVMSDSQQKKLEQDWEVDFSFGVKNLSRFRANVFIQKGSLSGAFRAIPHKILDIDTLGLPPIVKSISDRPNGLVLVTGPTGSGKSTTLAAMIDRINQNRHCHIITIEDPIEYIYEHKSSTVEQREVGTDTRSFHTALKSILRQDPDVVLLGEMRDIESIQAALTIAETGHLCFATLHTNSCAQTLSRIVDVFPGENQQQIRTQLSLTLNAVFSQVLLPKIGGGLTLAAEIMTGSPAIKSLIRENKIHNINNHIQLGASSGMQTLNQSLVSLVRNGLITRENALKATHNTEDLHKCLIHV
ncbi:Twitching motility protein PilT [Chitinispirillum alkaliphilum]|nr:Twitching motility protein PilT [Chitinispirillum alkaliphilum]